MPAAAQPVQPAPAAVQPPSAEPDPFDAAFAALAASDVAKPAEGDIPKPAEPKPEKTAEAKPESAPEPVAESAPNAAETGEGETAAPAEPSEPPEPAQPALTNEEMLARFAELMKAAEPQPKPKPPAEVQPSPQPKPEPAPQPEFYSKEEKEFLATYEKDWPDVARAETLRRRGEYQLLVQHIFAEINRNFAPVANMAYATAESTQANELVMAIPDYVDIREDVIEWAQEQPQYLKIAFNHVINHGTVPEIVDLVDRWRYATNGGPTVRPPAATGVAAPRAQAPVAVPAPTLSPEAQKAARALAPVPSKRSNVVSQVDPNDFDGAFAEFAGKV